MKGIYHKKRLEKKYIALIIIISVLIIISLLSLSIRDDRNLTTPEKIIKDVGVGTQNILYTPIRFIIDKIDKYNDMKKIYGKYKNIDEANQKVLLLEEENKELKKSIDTLKKLLELNKTIIDYNAVNATIINRDVGNWYNNLTIDKGESSGIKTGNIVINNYGLIGKIIKTSKYSSDIKLITTPDLNIKISVAITNDTGITYGLLSGYNIYDKELQIIDIIDDTKINIGDSVITSGLSNNYPKGIIIGKVSKAETNEFGISKIIKVTPSVNFSDIDYVTVLREKK
jgi:rod shape-determining protein MreC